MARPRRIKPNTLMFHPTEYEGGKRVKRFRRLMRVAGFDHLQTEGAWFAFWHTSLHSRTPLRGATHDNGHPYTADDWAETFECDQKRATAILDCLMKSRAAKRAQDNGWAVFNPEKSLTTRDTERFAEDSPEYQSVAETGVNAAETRVSVTETGVNDKLTGVSANSVPAPAHARRPARHSHSLSLSPEGEGECEGERVIEPPRASNPHTPFLATAFCGLQLSKRQGQAKVQEEFAAAMAGGLTVEAIDAEIRREGRDAREFASAMIQRLESQRDTAPDGAAATRARVAGEKAVRDKTKVADDAFAAKVAAHPKRDELAKAAFERLPGGERRLVKGPLWESAPVLAEIRRGGGV